ncbi:MAG: hypothetical protein E7536_09050 [Ruminococcaceae bacterium]|nr:hypothetical protein [Oscillospiraceae bacterium]
MRCLERNKIPFHYCLFKEKEAIRDESGHKTGEYRLVYEEPVEMKANISPATGESQIEQFGTSLQYDKVIVVDDMACPIDENTVLFVDSKPSFNDDATPVFDYIVKKVAKSLNSISIAISKVKVS